MVQTSLTSWLSRKSIESASGPLVAEEVNNAEDSQATCPPVETASSANHDEIHNQEQGSNPNITNPIFNLNRPLPREIQIQPITKDNLRSFRRLITLLLPVPYSDKFYTETIADEVANSVSRVAVWTEECRSSNGAGDKKSKSQIVAAIRCRVLPSAPGHPSTPTSASTPNSNSTSTTQTNTQPTLYIATIATLAPYRNLGIAGSLLQLVTAEAMALYGVGSVTAHVWEANEEAREWYGRLEFRERHFDGGYYTRIEPRGAWLLERRVDSGDLVDGGG